MNTKLVGIKYACHWDEIANTEHLCDQETVYWLLEKCSSTYEINGKVYVTVRIDDDVEAAISVIEYLVAQGFRRVLRIESVTGVTQ